VYDAVEFRQCGLLRCLLRRPARPVRFAIHGNGPQLQAERNFGEVKRELQDDAEVFE
jgi:hypothetical protein